MLELLKIFLRITPKYILIARLTMILENIYNLFNIEKFLFSNIKNVKNIF